VKGCHDGLNSLFKSAWCGCGITTCFRDPGNIRYASSSYEIGMGPTSMRSRLVFAGDRSVHLCRRTGTGRLKKAHQPFPSCPSATGFANAANRHAAYPAGE